MKSVVIPVAIILGSALVWFFVHLVSYQAHLQRPAQPGPPAAVIFDGKSWPCAPVRRDWADGNMDAWDSFPVTVQVRCTVG